MILSYKSKINLKKDVPMHFESNREMVEAEFIDDKYFVNKLCLTKTANGKPLPCNMFVTHHAWISSHYRWESGTDEEKKKLWEQGYK